MSRLDPSLLAPVQFRINPGPTPVERAQQDALITDRQAQVQERQAQADALRLAHQKARAAYNASQGIRAWLANNPEAFKADPQGAMSKLLSIGGPEGIPIVKDMLDQNKSAIEQAQSHIKFQQDITKDLADAFSLEADPAKHQELERQVFQKYVQSGALTQDQANAMLQQPPDGVAELQAHQIKLARDNAALKQAAETSAKVEEAFKFHAEGKKAEAEATKATTEAEVAPYGKSKPFPAEVQRQRIEEKTVPQPPMSPERFTQEKELKEIGQGDAVQLTPQGLDAAATAFAKTGQLPPMGMGKQGAAVRSQIINRAAAIAPDLDIASNKADFEANKGSLAQATKLKDALSSFENTALANMKILESSAQKVIDSGSPLINKPLRTIDEKALGNTELPVYRAARQIVVNEVAKLTGNPGLTGTLSDTARKEVSELLPPDMTLGQLVRLLPTLRQDMKNRTGSIDQQIEAIRQRIKGGGATNVPIVQQNKKTGDYRHSTDGGKTWQAGKPAQ